MSYRANITTENSADILAVVSLGSNLASEHGEPKETLDRALTGLEGLSGKSLLVSSYYQTAPVDCLPGTPDFLNAIAILQPLTDVSPEAMLHDLLAIESRFGRLRGDTANQPRSLDLDLICFGNHVIESDFLNLPHPRAQHRRFVLEPLAELVPNFVIPGSQHSVSELLLHLPPGQALVRTSYSS